jgi:molybdopterin-binding protein
MWHENWRAQSPEGQDCQCKEGASPANVRIKVGGGTPITDETVEQFKLARGKTAWDPIND